MIIPLLIFCNTFFISEAIKEKNKLSLLGHTCYILVEFINTFSLFDIKVKFKIMVSMVF